MGENGAPPSAGCRSSDYKQRGSQLERGSWVTVSYIGPPEIDDTELDVNTVSLKNTHHEFQSI